MTSSLQLLASSTCSRTRPRSRRSSLPASRAASHVRPSASARRSSRQTSDCFSRSWTSSPTAAAFPSTASSLWRTEIKSVFGGVPRAFSLVRRVTGTDEWDAIRRQRTEDTLVYLALASFPKRPRFGVLPPDLRNDIRAFFGTYTKACQQADTLLYAAGNLRAINAACEKAEVGKLLPEAFYVHQTALPRLPALLRVYEGCGRQLVGAVDGMTVIKLSRDKATMSYLVYPDFDQVGHPRLAESFIVDLSRLVVRHRDYRQSASPPVLHRKELLVASDYPSRPEFHHLTAQEELHGLLCTGRPIGTQRDWLALLSERQLQVRGHTLLRAGDTSRS